MSMFTVVAGGWSVTNIDLARLPGHVIAVNDSFRDPRMTPYGYLGRLSIVTMDRLWAENRWEELRKLNIDYGMLITVYARRQALKNITRPQSWLRVFECDHENPVPSQSASLSVLNGPSSGHCAVNLALLLARAMRGTVYLLGFDMQPGPEGQKHWYPDYEWSSGGRVKKNWADQFSGLEGFAKKIGVRVVNVGDRSLVPNFPRMSYEEFNKGESQ